MHHPASPAEPSDPTTERFVARLGLLFFAVYLTGYAAFVVALATGQPFDAVAAGMGLIGGAVVLSLLYAALCRTPAAGRP
jgi:hypothetical protein